MGESLVSKGADVLSLSTGGSISGWFFTGPQWHQLSKGYQVNIPEPDTWMLHARPAFTGGQRVWGTATYMCVYARRRLR